MSEFEHERLDVYRIAIEFLAMVLKLHESGSGSRSGSRSGQTTEGPS